MEPQISIVVPVFNCAPYLIRCLDSLRSQSAQSIEFILVNNGSTDGSGKILEDYQKIDERFMFITQENHGVSGGRNTGLFMAKGEYVGFVDADDYVNDNMFEKMYRKARETESDIVSCDYSLTFPNKEIGRVLNMKDQTTDVSEIGIESFYLRYLAKNPVVWNKLYRRELLSCHGIHFEADHGEDLLFNLRLAPFVGRISTISACEYHYVQRRSSLVHRINVVKDESANILSKYLEGDVRSDATDALSYYAFSSIFTGFMFSAHCIGKSVAFFKEQICGFRKFALFNAFCRKISRTNDLSALYMEQTISRRFYLLQKILFFLCLTKHDTSAAVFMWLCAKLIVIKKRKFLYNQFD